MSQTRRVLLEMQRCKKPEILQQCINLSPSNCQYCHCNLKKKRAGSKFDSRTFLTLQKTVEKKMKGKKGKNSHL